VSVEDEPQPTKVEASRTDKTSIDSSLLRMARSPKRRKCLVSNIDL
jgi:hypothetical protein